MRFLRATMMIGLLCSPAMAEEEDHVIGAKRPIHNAAPKAGDGQGDYGFSVRPEFSGESATPYEQSETGLTPTLSADADLQAYDEEEAQMEAEAAIALDETANTEVALD